MTSVKRLAKDEKVLRVFIATYCRQNHLNGGVSAEREEQGRHYCAECAELLDYALQRLQRCPLNPKPACRDCPVHCYRSQMRERIRQVMKFSGLHFVKRGRLDWLWHYFF
ncbi:nitrous oxide-stimulated promoter family protein [uncultured Desulfuromonas sp.]|uniref:nitrous oxide-stimulated promoter family protein n=1 Tax=uncultured Desulfuromonas sp. TaxID=181013 RepID=UPI002AAA7DB0|nr:nitrous oxide-stimulated promoter family protein [uncultured Desulfuromonas sp.]